MKAEWARVAPLVFGAYHDHGYRDAMGGAVGKVPKDFDENGRPGPLPWNKPHPKARLKRAANAGANIFIRNERDPSLDFDCKTAPVADALENVGANLAKRKGHKAPLSVRYRDNSPSSRAAQVALEDGAAPLDGWKITATEENALAALGRPPQRDDFKPGGALYGATHAFEFRGAGQLTVMEGIHTSGARLKTRGPHPATVGRDQLLKVNAADSDWLKVEIAAAFGRPVQAVESDVRKFDMNALYLAATKLANADPPSPEIVDVTPEPSDDMPASTEAPATATTIEW